MHAAEERLRGRYIEVFMPDAKHQYVDRSHWPADRRRRFSVSAAVEIYDQTFATRSFSAVTIPIQVVPGSHYGRCHQNPNSIELGIQRKP